MHLLLLSEGYMHTCREISFMTLKEELEELARKRAGEDERVLAFNAEQERELQSKVTKIREMLQELNAPEMGIVVNDEAPSFSFSGSSGGRIWIKAAAIHYKVYLTETNDFVVRGAEPIPEDEKFLMTISEVRQWLIHQLDQRLRKADV